MSETIKSTFIANRDATPTVATAASIAGGHARESEGYVTVSASAASGSKYPMASIPSNTRVSSVKLQCAALGSGCTAKVGVYAPTLTQQALTNLNAAYTGGAAISDAYFASGLDVSGALAVTDITNQSGSNTISKQELELWQAIGLASDPGCMLDIGVALSAAAVAGGLLGLKVAYIQ